MNTMGSYQCQCSAGYQGNDCLDDVNECQSNRCRNGASCMNTMGSYQCQCSAGYQGNDCSEDVDECQSNPCMNRATCSNTMGSYECQCSAGYQGDACTEDVDECALADGICLANYNCSNTLGSYTCACADDLNSDGECRVDATAEAMSDSEDSGSNWWLIVIGIACLLIAIAVFIAGTIYGRRRMADGGFAGYSRSTGSVASVRSGSSVTSRRSTGSRNSYFVE